MPDNAYNDLSYSAKKTIQTSSFVLFFIPSKKVIQDSISVFSFPTTLKMKLQVLVSFQFRFPTTLDKITLTSTVIGNDNRTEWSPIRSVIIRVITNRTTAQRESDLFVTSMITDRIGRHEVLLPINHKNYNFREKMNSQVIKERENLHLMQL